MFGKKKDRLIDRVALVCCLLGYISTRLIVFIIGAVILFLFVIIDYFNKGE